jgi:hypothetical protein
VKNKIKTMVAAAFAAVIFGGVANASTVYDTSLVSPGVYFGSGNGGTNVGWTVNTDGSVELGLVTIHRGGAAVIPTPTNFYNVPTGASAPGRAWWNFDFSVNLRAGGTGTLTLGDVTPTLTIQDYLHGTTVSFNPFTGFNDNSAFDGTNPPRNGNNPPPDGTGQPATTADVGFQNSENLTFGQFAGLGFNMNLNDTFLITLSLLNNSDNSSLGSVSEFVVAGTGAPTPLPAAAPLFASGLAGFGWLVRRRKKKLAA